MATALFITAIFIAPHNLTTLKTTRALALSLPLLFISYPHKGLIHLRTPTIDASITILM